MRLTTRVLYIASLAAFMRSFSQVIYVPSQIEILNDLEITTASFGLTLSIFALTFAVAQLFFGPVVDRYDSKKVLLAGMLLFTIGNLGGLFVQNIGGFFVIRTLQALGIAAAVIVGIAFISDVIPPSERGQAMGTFEILNAAGAAAGPVIGALTAVWFGWRMDFLLLGLLGLGLAGLAYWQLPKLAVVSARVGIGEMIVILRNPPTLGATIIGFIYFYALFAVFTLLPLMLSTRFGISIGSTGILVSLLPFGAIIGSLFGGKAADKTNTRNVIIPGSIVAACSFAGLAILSIPLDQSISIAFVGGAVIAAGIAIGFGLPAQIKIMVDHFPTLRGTASGISLFFRFLGATFAPVVTGHLADTYGLATGFASATALLTAGTLISVILIKEPPLIQVDSNFNTSRP